MAELTLDKIEQLRQTLKEPAKDMKLNLSNVLKSDILSEEQIWGVALASAYFLRDETLRDAILSDAKQADLRQEMFDDAQAAASLMGMNTAFYRFRHLVGKESYTKKPAQLRMQWMAKPKTSKADFELLSLACAVLAGCEMCIKTHEASLLKHGLTEDHVQAAARIASVMQGVTISLQF